MPAVTPSYKVNLSLGSRDAVVMKLTAADPDDTVSTGLAVIEHVSITNVTSGVTVGYTVSGGVITLKLSGSISNATVLAIGFK